MTFAAETSSAAAREFHFDAEDFRQIAAMLHADAGIFLSDQKASLVYSRLVKRLRELGLQSFRQYCGLISSSGGVDERQKMLAALTTNVTRFYREAHHFTYLRDTALPPLLNAAKRGARVRIWSAGCSMGQEPYTIAMTILNLMPDACDYDIRILATDIDPEVLDTARAGLYDDDDLADVPGPDRARFFRRVESQERALFQVSAPLADLIAFKKLNLIGDWPMRGQFDIIFCRNVVIYFDAATQATIWRRYADSLRPGGLLCIGHSERLSGPAQASFHNTGTTVFKLNAAVGS